MSAEPNIDALIESIADGGSIDWAALEASASDEQRRLIRHLRLVAGVAEVHRSTSAEELASSGTDWMQPGQAIPRWGRLLLMEKIGEGTFGEVYRARDPWLDREVALKLLKPGSSGNVPPSRILNEARTLARVRHPNVVTVHGADLNDGRVGLWMEFVRGRTLTKMMDAQGPMSAPEAAIVGQEICRALAAVHAVGLVHGDIKAQNVMRESGGRFVLMDFGAGQFVDRRRSVATRPAGGSLSGTPLYLAPEVLQGGEPTIQSDIYALGVLLYWLVTGSYPVGSYPVKAASLEHLKAAHARGERRHLRDARPELPDSFVAAVERALDPDPQRRFPTAGEMLPALARVTGGGLSARIAAIKPELSGASGKRKLFSLVAAAGLVLAVAAGLVYWLTSRSATSTYTAAQHIAVMPLRGDKTEAYFADGMTEALMQELASLKSLRVMSRTSVERALQTSKSLPEIARALNADALLEGALSHTEDRIRLSIRLVHAGSDTPIWVRTFEHARRNVFALQRDVAHAVAEELEIGLAPPGERRPPQVVDPRAHEDYLRGRYFLRSGSVDERRLALRYFESALAKDPTFADAAAALGHAYHLLSGALGVMSQEEAFRRSREAALRALRLDPQLAYGHAVLAEVIFLSDWDWRAAEREYWAAISLNPSLEFGREWYALFLAARGRIDEARLQLREAQRLDPLSPVPIAVDAAVLQYSRKYIEAVDEYKRALAIQQNYQPAMLGLARTLKAMGEYDRAIELYRSIRQVSQREWFVVSEIAQAEALSGRRSAALAGLEELRRLSSTPDVSVPPEAFAYVYAALGDKDSAFMWLERAFDERAPGVLWAAVDPRLDPVRSDARFSAYLDRLGLH